MNERDIIIMARTVYGEARGESPEGQEAVANVILNRAKKHRISPAKACLKSIHFSAWNNARSNDENQLAMMTADLSDPVYRQCLESVLRAVRAPSRMLKGYRHYHTVGVSPRWSKGKPYVTIGGHRFYRGIA